MTVTAKAKRIAELNDEFRREITLATASITPPPHGKLVGTPGIEALSLAEKFDLLSRVHSFEAFTPDNDPHQEHDFGAFDMPGAGKIFWKIDYYDADLVHGSEDPANPEVTTRVLTIMLAEEY